MRFNVGDRVQIISSYYESAPVGTIGIVTESNNSTTMVNIGTEMPQHTHTESGSHLCWPNAHLVLATQGDNMPRELRAGDRVRILPNPTHSTASNECQWPPNMDRFVGDEFVLENMLGSNWTYETWSWAPEWLELVEARPPMEPKYNTGDKLLYASEIVVEVVEWLPDTEKYKVKSLNTSTEYESVERMLKLLSDKAVQRRLEKIGVI